MAPEAAGGDLVRVKGRLERRRHLHVERREIVVGEESAVRLMKGGDGAGGVAPVEGGTGRQHAGDAPAPRRGLGPRHGANRLRELRLHEDLAGSERAAVAEEERGRRRPLPVGRLLPRHLVGREARDRKAALGAFERGGDDVGERHRAPARERREPGGRRRGHHGPRHARRDLAAVAVAEVLERDRARVGAHARDLPGLTRPRQMHQDRRDSREADHVGVHDPEAEPAGDAGVDRVAAGLEQARGGRGRQRMARGDGPAGPDRLDRVGRCVGAGLGVGGVERHARQWNHAAPGASSTPACGTVPAWRPRP